MLRDTDVRLVDVSCELEATPFRAPLKFGGRVVDGSHVLNVTVVVETPTGRRASGLGSMPLGNVWAWPSKTIEPDVSAEAVIRVAQALAAHAHGHREFGHPLDIVTALEHDYLNVASLVTGSAGMGLVEAMPTLAVLVAASPLDAAIHDAFGKAHGRNVYDCYGSDFCGRDLSAYLTDDFRGEYLDRYTLREPKATMPLYHLVGALDPLTAADVTKPIADGLPETLEDWIAADGLTHLKIKLSGDDAVWDLSRAIAVDEVCSQPRWAGRAWQFSLDFNEKCPSVGALVDFLSRLKARRPSAFERVQYLEQPTARDLRANPDNRMHAAARLKPVVIDESLTDLPSLQLAVELGYSGVALKACKGQTAALLCGAYAQKHGLFLCVQDLTCPGASFLHSAGLAARLPTVAAIEGNARQYCPAGSRGWSERYPSVFRVVAGRIETGMLTGPGLGHT